MSILTQILEYKSYLPATELTTTLVLPDPTASTTALCSQLASKHVLEELEKNLDAMNAGLRMLFT
jgi:hypothetical protein